MKLGLSLYPEQESKEQIEAYLKMGAKYGFDYLLPRFFRSMEQKKKSFNIFKNSPRSRMILAMLWMAMSTQCFLSRTEPITTIFPFLKKWESTFCGWMSK
nr:hypothetical protein [Dubosiella newyorkensis]